MVSRGSEGRVVAVIPAYNEGGRIGDVVRRAKRFVDQVIVVDDGSSDETAGEARDAGALVVAHPVNMGKWAALKTGVQEALGEGADIIVTLDADGQHLPEEIPKLILALEDADVAVGFRSREGMPIVRRLSNFITTGILRVLLRVRIRDSQCGFRAYRREAAELLLQVEGSGYEGETESLVLLARAGMHLRDVPVSTIYAGEESKIRATRDIARFSKTVLRLLLRRRGQAGKEEGESKRRTTRADVRSAVGRTPVPAGRP